MHSFPTAHVPLPDVTFDADGQPYSRAFDDVYFSRSGGAAETEYVFLRGNGLPERWQQRAHFTIGELGFGTGLNFLVTYDHFLRSSALHQRLHFVSVEKYPLTPELLQRLKAGGMDARLHPHLDALIAAYPLRLPGWHRLHFERCTLTLGFGDATELLSGLTACVDAWFIDGFSPAKNPGMWEAPLFAQLARLSAANATCATFTAAGHVRRGLQAEGFRMEKRQGYAHKREMLVGQRDGAAVVADRVRPRAITILGAGIAGATTAYALAERGAQVTVLDRRPQPADGASGNPAGVLYPQITKHYTPATAWHFTGYAFMLRQVARWRSQGLAFTHAQPGMLRLPRPEHSAHASDGLQLDPEILRYVSQAEASELAGTRVASDGSWLPHGTWIAPAELCRALLQHPNIRLHTACEATSIQPASDAGWRIHTGNGAVVAADTLVLATAQDTAALLPGIALPMGVSAGQISLLRAAETHVPRCIISHRGYVIPLPASQQILVGATYDRNDLSCRVTADNHEENIGHLRAALPHWPGDTTALAGRTALRATTPDRLPYVGEALPNLYVTVGHGSRGMISAPLAAEIIASMIYGEPVPLAQSLLNAIYPHRRR